MDSGSRMGRHAVMMHEILRPWSSRSGIRNIIETWYANVCRAFIASRGPGVYGWRNGLDDPGLWVSWHSCAPLPVCSSVMFGDRWVF